MEQFSLIGSVSIDYSDGQSRGVIGTDLYRCVRCGDVTADISKHTEKCRDEERPPGAWFVFGYDVGAYPIALFATQAEADHEVATRGYGNVRFWPFDKEWAEVQNTEDEKFPETP